MPNIINIPQGVTLTPMNAGQQVVNIPDNVTLSPVDAAPAPTENFFSQWGHNILNAFQHPTAPATPDQQAAFQSLGNGPQLSDMGKALVHHFDNPLVGVRQLVDNAGGKLGDVLPPGELADYLKGARENTNAFVKNREANYQAEVPNSPQAYTGATIGEVAPWLLSAPSKALEMVGEGTTKYLPKMLEKLSPYIKGAAQGGTIAATAPVTGSDFWNEKAKQELWGEGTGVLSPIAAKLLRAIYGGLKNTVLPFSSPDKAAAQTLADSMGLNPSEVSSRITNAEQNVPGVKPTTAQLLQSPQAAALEKALRNNKEMADEFHAIDIGNNKARLNYLNSIGGTSDELKALETARNKETKPLYQQAFSEYNPENISPDVKEQLTTLMARPAMKQAMAQGFRDAKNEGVDVSDPYSTEALHYAKQALDKMVNRAYDSNTNVRGLQDTKSNLLNILESEKYSPTYQLARQKYQQLSVPINTMKLGNDLRDIVADWSPNASTDPQLSYSRFTNRLNKALNDQDYSIDPDALAKLEGIKSDLNREAAAMSGIRKAGSDTTYNLNSQGWLNRQLYGKDYTGGGWVGKGIGGAIGGYAGTHVGHPLGGMAGGVATAAKLSDLARGRVNDAMLKIMTDPQKATEALDKLSPKQRNFMTQLLLNHPVVKMLSQ